MNHNKQIPFNTGKVLIGSAYEAPKLTKPSPEDEFWRSVLLGDREARRIQRIQRIQRICYLVVLVGMFTLAFLTLGNDK